MLEQTLDCWAVPRSCECDRAIQLTDAKRITTSFRIVRSSSQWFNFRSRFKSHFKSVPSAWTPELCTLVDVWSITKSAVEMILPVRYALSESRFLGVRRKVGGKLHKIESTRAGMREERRENRKEKRDKKRDLVRPVRLQTRSKETNMCARY